ncbi:inorganic triphosphatase [Marinicellulosiphila megalodicopiae]|uniref:CYTH domain-containing protein n=1 Tax=Marinicellulosiphila megalodicopiae TaxID=2724896 RepID=UPI003BB213D6
MKLQIHPKDVKQLLELDCLKSNQKDTFVLKNTYFDTVETILANHKIALRIRQKGSRYIQTLKTQGENHGGLHIRSEYENDLRGYELELGLIEAPLNQLLTDHTLSDLELLPIFSTDFTRHEIQLNAMEFVLDQGCVTYKNLKDQICEVELELKVDASIDFSQKHHIQLIFQLAQKIAQNISVMPSDTSKALRGERLKLLEQGKKYQVNFEKIPEKSTIQQKVACFLQFIQSNWEAFYFLKQTAYLASAIDAIGSLLDLLKQQQNTYYAHMKIPLQAIIDKWRKLLIECKPSLNEVQLNQLIDSIFQDKEIGQIWLSMSMWCHLGGNHE